MEGFTKKFDPRQSFLILEPPCQKHWSANSELMAELADRLDWCLDLIFMHALLRLGYEYEDTRDVVIEKKIQGTELGWCLVLRLPWLVGS